MERNQWDIFWNLDKYCFIGQYEWMSSYAQATIFHFVSLLYIMHVVEQFLTHNNILHWIKIKIDKIDKTSPYWLMGMLRRHAKVFNFCVKKKLVYELQFHGTLLDLYYLQNRATMSSVFFCVRFLSFTVNKMLRNLLLTLNKKIKVRKLTPHSNSRK